MILSFCFFDFPLTKQTLTFTYSNMFLCKHSSKLVIQLISLQLNELKSNIRQQIFILYTKFSNILTSMYFMFFKLTAL